MNRAGLKAIYEFPPTDFAVPAAKSWIKELSNPVTGISGQSYARYGFIANSSSINPGNYTAWSNSVYGYSPTTSYASNEWPPSGAFDKRAASNFNTAPGYNQDAADYDKPTILKKLFLSLPYSILLNRYTLECRSDGAAFAQPLEWYILGSRDGVKWDILDARAGVTNWALGMVQTFNVTMPRDTYSLFQFASYHSRLSLGEWRLFGSKD